MTTRTELEDVVPLPPVAVSQDPVEELMTAEVPISTPNEHGVFETCTEINLPMPGKAFLRIALARSEADVWHADSDFGVEGGREGCFHMGGLPDEVNAHASRREAVLTEIATALYQFEIHSDRHGDAKRAMATLIRLRNEVQAWQPEEAAEADAPAQVPLFTPSQHFTVWAEPPATTPTAMDARLLKMHPMLERITMMPEVMNRLGNLKVRKPEHDAAECEIKEDWDAFCDDIAAHGVLEPLKVCEVEGQWLVADGRHRHEAAMSTGRFVVPVVVVSEEQALTIIHATVFARRSWTKGMKAYFGVLMHPEVVTTKPGNPRLKKSNSDSIGIGMTRVELARKCGVSADLIDQAAEIYGHCERSKKIREKYEWRVFSGSAGLGGILAGIGAELAGEEEENLNGRSRLETPWKHLCAGLDKAKRYLADWEGLTEAQRETATTAFASLLDAAPPELLALATQRAGASAAEPVVRTDKSRALKP